MILTHSHRRMTGMSTATRLHRPLDLAPDSIPDLLRDLIVAGATEAEALRRLPDELRRQLRAAGAFRLCTPVELGGFELPLGEQLRIHEAIGRLDGSVAWNVWNGNLGFLGAMLPMEGVAAIWATDSDPIIANSARVTGGAVAVDGGYRLSGRWELISGIDSADWVTLFGVVLDGEAPRMTPVGPDVRAFTMPAAAVAVIDTWHVNGMRGTGSKSAVADGVFIPEALAPSPFAPARIDRALYRIPAFTLASSGCAAVLMGMAASAIDALVDLAGTKGSDSGAPLADRAHVQGAIGAADATLRAARAGLYGAVAAIDDAAQAGRPITDALRGALRGSMAHCGRTAREVTSAMFELGSSASVFAGGRLERLFRDVHVAAQHGLLNRTVFDVHGRLVLGRPAGVPVI